MQTEKVVEIKQCKHCDSQFVITDTDLEFYEKVSPVFSDGIFSIPTPKLCPDCRQQRRLSFRNERKLYKRKCDATGKDIISIYSPDKPYKVYNQDFWWSDAWDAMEYGKIFNFEKLFFEQFGDLFCDIPKTSLPKCGTIGNENCDFTIGCEECKDSYLLGNSIRVIGGFYSRSITDSLYIFDSMNIKNSRNIYGSDTCEGSDEIFYCNHIVSSNNCFLCDDLVRSSNCLGSIGLVGKKFYILNKSYTKNEYYTKFQDILSDTLKFSEFLERYNKLKKSHPRKSNNINQENCFGDYCSNSKNCFYCFDIIDNQNCKYNYVSQNTQDSYDISYGGYNGSLLYELANSGVNVYKSAFVVYSYGFDDCFYIYDCSNIQSCFGCVGLRNKQYCIFNKQYTKEEYNILVPKIVEHMKETGEWGEFFPSSISPFGYNETVAMEYFPLPHPNPLLCEEKEYNLPLSSEGEGAGGGGLFNRSTYESPLPKVDKVIPASKLPENISDIPDDILNWAIECEVTNKPFRIIPQELEFYRKHNLPIPRRHPDQRHLDRMMLRNPRKLFKRDCDKCGVEMDTTYSPEREDIVYCEECYNKEVY